MFDHPTYGEATRWHARHNLGGWKWISSDLAGDRLSADDARAAPDDSGHRAVLAELDRLARLGQLNTANVDKLFLSPERRQPQPQPLSPPFPDSNLHLAAALLWHVTRASTSHCVLTRSVTYLVKTSTGSSTFAAACGCSATLALMLMIDPEPRPAMCRAASWLG